MLCVAAVAPTSVSLLVLAGPCWRIVPSPDLVNSVVTLPAVPVVVIIPTSRWRTIIVVIIPTSRWRTIIVVGVPTIVVVITFWAIYADMAFSVAVVTLTCVCTSALGCFVAPFPAFCAISLEFSRLPVPFALLPFIIFNYRCPNV